MTDSCAVLVDDLGKVFELPRKARSMSPGGIALVLAHIAGLPVDLARARARDGVQRPVVVALDGVTMQVERGEAVCLRGPSRSGKSTLLSVLSGATPPSRGRAVIRGRCAALLDVRHDLDRAAIVQPFVAARLRTLRSMGYRNVPQPAEIVSFAELGGFENARIGKLSSGMQMRLSMALLLAGDPDVLLLDDVMGVGDVSFREKCIERFKAILARGGSLVVVSPDEWLVSRLGARLLTLQNGTVASSTQADLVGAGPGLSPTWTVSEKRIENEVGRLGILGVAACESAAGTDIRLRFKLELLRKQTARPVFDVTLDSGATVMRAIAPADVVPTGPGVVEGEVLLPVRYFAPGRYWIEAIVFSLSGGMQHVLRMPGAVELLLPGTSAGGSGPPVTVELPWDIAELELEEAGES